MPAETNQTTIINRGLQHVGYRKVSGIQANDRGARAMDTAYKPVLYSVLQENHWSFSIKRASLPKDTIPPVHGPDNRFRLPGDYIMLAPEDQTSDFPRANDWIIEGDYILTNDDEPIKVRYVSLSVNEAQFPALFAESFSLQLAVATVEELTQSTTKLRNLMGLYDRQINLAKKRNFIVSPKPKVPVSPWISGRA